MGRVSWRAETAASPDHRWPGGRSGRSRPSLERDAARLRRASRRPSPAERAVDPRGAVSRRGSWRPSRNPAAFARRCGHVRMTGFFSQRSVVFAPLAVVAETPSTRAPTAFRTVSGESRFRGETPETIRSTLTPLSSSVVRSLFTASRMAVPMSGAALGGPLPTPGGFVAGLAIGGCDWRPAATAPAPLLA